MTRATHVGVLGIPLLLASSGLAAPTPEQLRDAAALFGDLDHSGAVDAADLTELLRLCASPLDAAGRGDLNRDGAVDREDVRTLLGRLGDVPEAELYEILRSAGIIGRPASDLSTASGNTHHPVISSSNPNHSTEFSASHPNHGTAMSDTWEHSQILSSTGAPPHALDVSASHWPPNHDGRQSILWETLPVTPHLTAVSAGWPPSHLYVVSQSFPHPEHENHISRTWPPGHEYETSTKPGPWKHNRHNSSTYPNHNTTQSRKWPNHRQSFSIGWTNHTLDASALWPPNHFAVITASWDDNDHKQAVSATWPPNWHSQAYSEQAVIVVPSEPANPDQPVGN